MTKYVKYLCYFVALCFVFSLLPYASADEIINETELILPTSISRQLSEAELQMDTQALVDFLLANKYSFELIAMDSLEAAYRSLFLTFNIFQELETRTDAAAILLNKLLELSHESLEPSSSGGVTNRLNYVMLLIILEESTYTEQLTLSEQSTLASLRNIDGNIHPYSGGQYGESFYDAKLGITFTIATSTYTRDGTEVPLYSPSRELTDAQITDFNSYYAEKHPNASFYSAPSSTYNCHAYAWYSSTPSYWLADVERYLADNHIYEIFYEGYAEAGDIVVYYNADGTITHSAVITSNNNGEITCISK